MSDWSAREHAEASEPGRCASSRAASTAEKLAELKRRHQEALAHPIAKDPASPSKPGNRSALQIKLDLLKSQRQDTRPRPPVDAPAASRLMGPSH